jgi:P27 family predicted phage terminase small subunit
VTGALELWHYYAARLAELRVLAATDREALLGFCIAAEGVRICRETLEREGHFYTSPDSGLRREHPAGKALRDWLLRLQSLAGELGLTPATRSRVTTLPEDEIENELEKLLREPN